MRYQIELKRVYEPTVETDGARVLVDRLWPRGKKREDLQLTEWLRDAAPSTALRRAWHRGLMGRDAFRCAYENELQTKSETLVPLMRYARAGCLTLLTASRNPTDSHLPVLRETLLQALEKEDRQADDRDPSSPTCYHL